MIVRKSVMLSIISTLLVAHFVTAQEATPVVKDSLQKLFNFFNHGTKLTKLDREDLKYSGRGTWISALCGLIQAYNNNGLDPEPIYKELCDILANDKYPSNRLVAAAGMKLTIKKKAIEPLKKALNDKSLFVRNEAAISIVELGFSDDMEALQIIANTATYNNIEKMASIEAIDAGENPLIFLDSNDTDVAERILKNHRRRAIDILIKSNTKYANEVIIKLRQDKDEEVRNWTNDGILKYEESTK